MRILLTDPEERSSLAAARSLRAAGHDIFVSRNGRWALTSASRGVIPVPMQASAAADIVPFVEEVASLARRYAIELVLPVTDASTEALLSHAELLPSNAVLPFPAFPTWRHATDKARILTLSAECGLPGPDSRRIGEPADTILLPDDGFFPAVLKPHRSITVHEGRVQSLRVTRVADRTACLQALAMLPRTAFPVVLQREVSGPGEGLFLLRWKGRIVAGFAHRRLREKPPWGGVSVYRESIALPPDLLAAGKELLDRLDWSGVAMIECKRDLSTGRHVLMEINGRLWGSLQLAIDAGVDFPKILADCVAGAPPAAPPTYRPGVRSRWFWGDVDHLYLRLRHGPRRVVALAEFLRPGGPADREEIWRWRDPGPFIVESLRRLPWVRSSAPR